MKSELTFYIGSDTSITVLTKKIKAHVHDDEDEVSLRKICIDTY